MKLGAPRSGSALASKVMAVCKAIPSPGAAALSEHSLGLMAAASPTLLSATSKCADADRIVDAGARLQLDAGRHSITVCSGAWADAKRSGACSGDLRLLLRLAEPEYATWAVSLTRAIDV